LLAAGLGGHHSCVECVEKAHGKLWFVFWIARTAEIRCFRNALSLTGLQPGADLFWPSCCCCCWLQVSVVDTADSTASRRPTASFGLCSGSHGQPRYVAFATPFLSPACSQVLTCSGRAAAAVAGCRSQRLPRPIQPRREGPRQALVCVLDRTDSRDTLLSHRSFS
jgi:hypothetical protein